MEVERCLLLLCWRSPIDKKIIEKFNYCVSKPNINSVFLYTNGIYLDNYDEEFLSSGLNRLAISIFLGLGSYTKNIWSGSV